MLASANLIKPDPKYNDDASQHKLDTNKHQLFENCIDAIDETHVRTVLPHDE